MAVIFKVKNVLYTRKKEHDVYDAIENLCDFTNHDVANKQEAAAPIKMHIKGKSLDYYPIELSVGCQAIVASWESELENTFIGRTTDDLAELQTSFCGGSFNGNDFITNSTTYACKGVNMDDM